MDLSPYKDGSGRGNPDYVHIAPTPDTYRGKYTADKNPGKNLGEMYAKEVMKISVKVSDTQVLFCFICSRYVCNSPALLPAKFTKQVWHLR